MSRYVTYTRDILKGKDYEIGAYTYGTPTILKHGGVKLKIGKFCSIADGVTMLLGLNHRSDQATTYPFEAFPDNWKRAELLRSEEVDAISRGDVVVGNDVWIGWGAMILSGVKIGDGAVIGARAVVSSDVEPYSIVAGNPARLIKKRFDEGTIRKLLEIRWWDWPDEKISRNVEAICSSDVSKLFQAQ